MKRGDKVRCVDRGDSEYLTDGKVYEVTAGAHDISMFGDVIEGPTVFETVGDGGKPLYCYGLDTSSHATWELVE